MLNKIISLSSDIYSFGMPEHFVPIPYKLKNLGYIGAGNAIMSENKLPVPPGVTITIPAGERIKAGSYLELNQLMVNLRYQIGLIEKATGKQFGGADNPLLFAIRTSIADKNCINPPSIKYVGLNMLSTEALINLSGEQEIFNKFLDDWRKEFSFMTEIDDIIEDPYEQLQQTIVSLYRKTTMPIAIHLKMMSFEQVGQVRGLGIINTTIGSGNELVPLGSYTPWRQKSLELSDLKYSYSIVWDQIQAVVGNLTERMIEPQNTDFIVEDGKLWIYGLCCIRSVNS